MGIVHAVDSTSADEIMSVDTNLTERLRATTLKNNARKREDSDLDSIDNTSVNHERPMKVAFNDDMSTTSSLTTKTNNSKESILSDISNSSSTKSTDNFSLSSKKSKYTVTEELIAEIAKSEPTDQLTAERLHHLVANFQQHKMNEAMATAQVQVEKFINNNKVPSRHQKNNDANIVARRTDSRGTSVFRPCHSMTLP